MKFKSNSGKTLFMTIIIVFILVIIGAITYFGIISYPEVFNDIKVKVQQTFNKNEKTTLVVLQILLVKTMIYKISFIFLILDTVSIYPLL